MSSMYRIGQSVLLVVLVAQISGNVFLDRRADVNTGVNFNANINPPPMPDLTSSMPKLTSTNANGSGTPDYSLYGYMSSLYNYMPGIAAMKSFLQSALSYLPSGSSIYNAICKALDAVTPDYATLKGLYDQVRSQIVQDREARYKHIEEMMRIKHGYPDAPGGPPSGALPPIGAYPPKPQLPHEPLPQGPAGVLLN